jgi:mannose-6-phosphate isomerase-like protein (cupin superfamily)
MMRTALVWISGTLVLAAALAGLPAAGAEPPPPGGYVIERDADVAQVAPGPHSGTGMTTGYVFFEKVPGLAFSFRKRALHPGASIGYHEQKDDEVYYVVSGTGRMTIDGHAFDAKAGDAFLTRPGSSHGLVQTGDADLVILIAFEKKGP